VLIGTSAVGLLDSKTTPVDPLMPGVEVHAQVLENILTNSVLSSPNYAIGVELCAALLLGIIIIWLAPTLNPLLLLLVGATVVALSVGASWYFYVQNRLLFDFTYPLLSSALVYLTLVFSNYMSEQAQRRRIRSAFGQYLSPDLVEQLAQSPDKLVLGGEDREMSILFSDVRGFTTISELYKDDPQGLTSLMNSFLTPLTNAIIEHKGTIDKYMGDAVMAFWNAPLDDADHGRHACQAASGLAVVAAEAGLDISAGIATGEVTAASGPAGYGIHGDAPLLAERIRSLAHRYGAPVLVAEETRTLADRNFALLEIDTIASGAGNTRLYALMGNSGVLVSPKFRALTVFHDHLFQAIRKQNWRLARDLIIQCRRLSGANQALYDLHLARITYYERNPPGMDWDGAFRPILE